VRDTSGAIVPGANITATNEGTGITRTSVTDDGGEFTLTALPAGAYTLRIELQGFKTSTRQGLQLSPGQTSRQTFEIEVGTLEESVTVRAAAPLVETAASKQVATHTTDQVSVLPLLRRHITGVFSLSTCADTNVVGV